MVGVGLIEDCNGDARVSLSVRLLDASHGCVDQDILAVSVNPDRCDMWTAVSIHCSNECEVLAFEKLPCLFVQPNILLRQSSFSIPFNHRDVSCLYIGFERSASFGKSITKSWSQKQTRPGSSYPFDTHAKCME